MAGRNNPKCCRNKRRDKRDRAACYCSAATFAAFCWLAALGIEANCDVELELWNAQRTIVCAKISGAWERLLARND